MHQPITTAQLEAMRSLAAESPDRYSLLGALCNRVEYLQRVESAAWRFVTAEGERALESAAFDFCGQLGIAHHCAKILPNRAAA